MADPLPALPARRRDAHKGDAGRILILAGSRGMAGAAALAARGALRAGAGLVTVGTPEPIEPVVAMKLDCAMTVPLAATASGALAAAAVPAALAKAAGANAVALGPGLGTDDDTGRFLSGFLAAVTAPLVIDADALNLLAALPADAIATMSPPRILTPHPGEMSRLLGISTREVQQDREAVAIAAARRYAAVIVLKGADTVVTDGNAVHVNTTGNPGMATGGSGDVLTGVIAALVGQGQGPLDAARLGAHVHGLAGDLAAAHRGETSLTAADIADHLAAAFCALASATNESPAGGTGR